MGVFILPSKLILSNILKKSHKKFINIAYNTLPCFYSGSDENISLLIKFSDINAQTFSEKWYDRVTNKYTQQEGKN